MEARLEFYKYALEKINSENGSYYLCIIAQQFLKISHVGTHTLKKMFPEVCAYSNHEGDSLWVARKEGETMRNIRIEALEKAIIDVKKII
jgi:hypothetical protein